MTPHLLNGCTIYKLEYLDHISKQKFHCSFISILLWKYWYKVLYITVYKLLLLLLLTSVMLGIFSDDCLVFLFSWSWGCKSIFRIISVWFWNLNEIPLSYSITFLRIKYVLKYLHLFTLIHFYTSNLKTNNFYKPNSPQNWKFLIYPFQCRTKKTRYSFGLLHHSRNN